VVSLRQRNEPVTGAFWADRRWRQLIARRLSNRQIDVSLVITREAKYGPRNLFRVKQNIAPGRGLSSGRDCTAVRVNNLHTWNSAALSGVTVSRIVSLVNCLALSVQMAVFHNQVSEKECTDAGITRRPS
jgi:hypothetical protein